jgi:hypothetical protein
VEENEEKMKDKTQSKDEKEHQEDEDREDEMDRDDDRENEMDRDDDRENEMDRDDDRENEMDGDEDRKDEEKHPKDEKKKESLENESYIDIAIVKCQGGGQYLFIRQCANMVNITKNSTVSIFCGALSIKLNNDKLHTYNQFPVNSGEFYVNENVLKSFQEGIFSSILFSSFDRKILNLRSLIMVLI